MFKKNGKNLRQKPFLITWKDEKWKHKGSLQKKMLHFLHWGWGGGSGPVFVTLFFSKTWSKMA